MRYKVQYIIIFCLLPLVAKAQQNLIFEELPFNTKEFNEYAPFVYKNRLLFCSDQKNDVFVTYSTTEGRSLSNYYEVPNVGGLRWKNPVPFAPELMSQHHEGPFTIDFERDRIYFTRNIFYDKSFGNSLRDGNNLNIYTASYINNEFRNPQPLFPRTDQRFNLAFPSVGPDGNLLVFSSNEAGGQGGYDLYVSRYENRRWTKPENMGPKVNTNGNEVYPFVHSSGRVYFSSNRHGSQGRLDIFYTYFYDGEWVAPVSMGEPFNSRYNDMGVFIDDNLKTGYISSDRKRSYDIYRFEILYPVFEDCPEFEENTFCYEFFDQSSVEEMDTTAFMYEWDLGDGNIVRSERVVHCYEEPGMYFVQLNLVDVVTGEVLRNQSNYMLDLKYIEQAYISSSDTAYVNEEIVFDGLETNLGNFDIDEFYWFFGDDDWAIGSTVSHKFQKPGNYEVKLGLTSLMDERTQIKKACSTKRIVVLKR